MGYLDARGRLETPDRQGFWRVRRWQAGGIPLRGPAVRLASRISSHALFPARRDGVACGVTSRECRKAPKLKQTLCSRIAKCSEQEGCNHDEIRRLDGRDLYLRDDGHVRDRAAGEPFRRTN